MTNNNWEKEFIEKGAALEHDRLAKKHLLELLTPVIQDKE